MADGYDLVRRQAYVRIRSSALGAAGQTMAQGRVVAFRDHPSVEIEDADGQRSWWALSAVAEDPEHTYLSTACAHDLRGRCRLTCKWCLVRCSCSCHASSSTESDDWGSTIQDESWLPTGSGLPIPWAETGSGHVE